MPAQRDARQRILDAATQLFYAEGIVATGVDRVAAAAGVGKMSIYRHFDGKDALVAAVLQQRVTPHLDWLLPMDVLGIEQLLLVFERIERSSTRRDYRGCPFVRAALEISLDHPGRAVIADHKRQLIDRIECHLDAAGIVEVEATAQMIVTLIDGAATSCAVQRTALPAQAARLLAQSALGEASEVRS